MPHADILFKKLLQRNLNPENAKLYLVEFENVVKNIRNSAVDISSSYEQNEGNPRKKRKTTNKSADTKKVCDVIISHMHDRFSFPNHLAASKLIEIIFRNFTIIFQRKSSTLQLKPTLG